MPKTSNEHNSKTMIKSIKEWEKTIASYKIYKITPSSYSTKEIKSSFYSPYSIKSEAGKIKKDRLLSWEKY